MYYLRQRKRTKNGCNHSTGNRDNIFDVWSEAKRRSESEAIENDKYSISIKPDYLEEKMEDLADFIEKIWIRDIP